MSRAAKVDDFRKQEAMRRKLQREARALIRECWAVVPHVCANCGEYVNRNDASSHHLVPRSQGGSDRPANIVFVHYACHNEIELWTEEHGRPPNHDELGRLHNSNLLTPGVGTAKQEPKQIRHEPPLSVDDVPRYLEYLRKINELYQQQIANNPSWGMWVRDS